MTYLPLCNYDTSAAYVKGIYNLSAACVIITYLSPKFYDISTTHIIMTNLPPIHVSATPIFITPM